MTTTEVATVTAPALLRRGEVLVFVEDLKWARRHFTYEVPGVPGKFCPHARDASIDPEKPGKVLARVSVVVVTIFYVVEEKLAAATQDRAIRGFHRNARYVSCLTCPHCGRDGMPAAPMPTIGDRQVAPWGS